MRGELILVLVVAFYAGVKCEESAANVASEFVEASVDGGEKHEAQEKDYKMHLQKIDQIKMSLAAYQHQLEESQEQSKLFQAQIQIDQAAVYQLQQQVSFLLDANVQNGKKHQTQDTDYANLLLQIRQLQSNFTTYDQRLLATQSMSYTSLQQTSALQSQLQNATSALGQLQQQVSNLTVASVKSDQKHQAQDKDYANLLLEIQQMKLNLSSYQQQLDASKLLATSLQAQLQIKSGTIDLLQRQVSDLFTANLMATQQIQILKLNVTSQQNQLNVLQQKPAVQWVQWSVNDTIPKDALYAGQNADSSPMYVGRTLYKGVYSVVKVCPTLRNAFFSYAGQELTITSCEVLTGSDFYWQWGFKGSVPAKGVSVGQSGRYIGRAHAQQSLIPGTVDVVTGAIYVGHSGQEFRFEAYQVLVHD